MRLHRRLEQLSSAPASELADESFEPLHSGPAPQVEKPLGVPSLDLDKLRRIQEEERINAGGVQLQRGRATDEESSCSCSFCMQNQTEGGGGGGECDTCRSARSSVLLKDHKKSFANVRELRRLCEVMESFEETEKKKQKNEEKKQPNEDRKGKQKGAQRLP